MRVQSQSLGTTNAQRPTPVPKITPGISAKPRVVAAPGGSVAPMSTAKYRWTPTATVAELLAQTPLPAELDPVAAYLMQHQTVSDMLASADTGRGASNGALVPLATGSGPDAPALRTLAPAPTPAQAPVMPAQAPVMPAATVVPRPRTTVLTYTPQYQELPEAPQLAQASMVPVRDLLAEKQRAEDSSRLALLGPLAALLTGGSVTNAAQYVPVNLAAALSGAQAGSNRTFREAVTDYDLQRQATEQANADALAQYGREVTATNAHNVREARREQSVARLAAQAQKADTDLRKEGETFLKNLADLAPDSQRLALAAAQASGELDRLGIAPEQFTDAKGNFVPRVKAAPAGTLTAEQKIEQENKRQQTETLCNELKTQQGLLLNPRITKAGAEEAGKRIAQIQKKLGYGTGADVVSIGLDQFTPAQRAQIKLAQDRLALQKQNAANLQDYRSQTVAQRQAKAQAAAAKSTKAAGGDPTKAFNQNQRRISSIERELQGTNTASVTPERRAALEYERATLRDQQAVLSGNVPALTTGTRTRGGLPGGKPVTPQRKTPQVGGRVTAALASKQPAASPASKPVAETRQVTVDGGTFTVRRRTK